MGECEAPFFSERDASRHRLNRQERFEAEVLPHLRAMYATARRLTRNGEDAEDLVQETLLKAFAAFDRYTSGTNVRAWLYTILYRLRTDAYRRRSRRPQTVELTGDGPAVAPPQDALASGREDLERALADLPEAYRAAVVLRDVEELSYQEIARILDVALGTVMSRIHRGRGLLREALSGRKP